MERFRIVRDAPPGVHSIGDVADGLEDSPALQERFGGARALRECLQACEIEITEDAGYMWVDPRDGRIVTAREHWQYGDERTVYLDLVHELVHVKQHAEGYDLFDPAYPYVDRPTERDAYHITVQEARRIGLDDAELLDYLHVPWVTEEEHLRLARACGVKVDAE